MSADIQAAPTENAMDKQVNKRTKDIEKAQRRVLSNTTGHFQNKKHKHDHKFGRKRSQSFNAGNGKFFPPYKIRKKEFFIPPTKFLLGGNIHDPLNLNSLQDEEINRAMNAVTPKSSPLPTPRHRKGQIEVIIPPNINDPLNLAACDDDAAYEAMLISPIKRAQKKQKKNKKRKAQRSLSGSGKEDNSDVAVADSQTKEASPVKEIVSANECAETKKEAVEIKEEAEKTEITQNINNNNNNNINNSNSVNSISAEIKKPKQETQQVNSNKPSVRKIELKERKADLDKIVSPVIPQPGAWGDSRSHRFRPPQRLTPNINKGQATPKFKEHNTKFQYGNYNRYYGYRNSNQECDVRLRVLHRWQELFVGKEVLDIGCNVGHVTLAIARDFGPSKVVGIDIDRNLIKVARTNVRHYVNCGRKDKFFPVSMPIVYGPVDVPGVSSDKTFPHNVSFIQGNYVLESDILLQMEQPQFDVILCLSVTKWVHLNWGDAGLKRTFKRMYAQLRPGGVLILEAQGWGSYKRKKNLTEAIWNNYKSIEFYPHKFTQYLLSEVGFSKCEVIGAPFHQSRGFQRPIKLFTKGETPTTERTPATVVSDQTPATSSSDRTPAVFFDHKHASEYVPLTFSEHLPVRGSDYSPSHYYETDYSEIMPPEALAHRPASLVYNHRYQPRSRAQEVMLEHACDSSGVYSQASSEHNEHSLKKCVHSVRTGSSEKCELCLNKVAEESANDDTQEPATVDSQNSAAVCRNTGLQETSNSTETSQAMSTSTCSQLSASAATVTEASQNDEVQQSSVEMSKSDELQQALVDTQSSADVEMTAKPSRDGVQDSAPNSQTSVSDETLICTQSSAFADDKMTESSKSGDNINAAQKTAVLEESCE